MEVSCITGRGIDIGCGRDPIVPNVRCFDVGDGDANRITDFVQERFDFVFASHCLEHMHDPRATLLDWWKLVEPGGHIYFLVPDEDLYEQGVFPGQFNKDHKATFTISKTKSWSPLSINVLELARSLPRGSLVSLELQDIGYDRRLMRHGHLRKPSPVVRKVFRLYTILRNRLGFRSEDMEEWMRLYEVHDQTMGPVAMAQIQCIVRKLAD